jgi:hypothetical protein
MMKSTSLLMLFLLAAVLLLALRGPVRRATSRRFYFYYWPSVLVFSVLALCSGYFAWRDHASIQELKTLVDLPPYDKSVYVPHGTEIQTIARLLPANVPPNFPLTRQQTEQIRKDLMLPKGLEKFWILETPSSPDSVHDFYQGGNHRQGWEISEQSRIHFVLRRNGSTLTIFFLDDFPRPDTAIVYLFRETAGHSE